MYTNAATREYIHMLQVTLATGILGLTALSMLVIVVTPRCEQIFLMLMRALVIILDIMQLYCANITSM